MNFIGNCFIETRRRKTMDRGVDLEGSKLNGHLCDMTDDSPLSMFCNRKSRTRITCCTCGTFRKPVLPKLGLNLHTLSVILTVFLFSQIVIVESSPRAYKTARNFNTQRAQREDAMVKYLGNFGYLNDASQETGPAGLTSKEVYIAAIKRLQRFGHVPETGVVDRRTLELIKKPRCGVKDEIDTPSLKRHRRKRFVTAPSKWEKNDLTYRILNTTPDLSVDKVRRIIASAFKLWSDVTALTFTETINSHADILIQFATGYHHDGYPFDGQGSVLAHAFFPGDDRGGDTHFDDAETWTFNSSEGVDLYMVAAHEFGHALGLAHSSNTDALMYPWYQGYEEGFKLPYDDVLGIQTLYGAKGQGRLPPRREHVDKTKTDKDKARTDETTRPPVVVPDDSINPCLHSIDALTVIRKEVFIFIGSQFWRLGSNGISSTPTQINKFWYNLPEDGIDAVYERSDGKIVFFKGDRYWMFSSNHMVPNFPKEGRRISELGIDKEVKKIDAVFVWAYNKRTYLVTGDMYWKLNAKDNYIEYDYPRDMSIWKNVPVPLDSAFQHWDGKTFFLQGDQYWEFYDNKMKTRRKEGKPISKLFGCRNGKLNSNLVMAFTDQESSATSVQILLTNLVILFLSIHVLQ